MMLLLDPSAPKIHITVYRRVRGKSCGRSQTITVSGGDIESVANVVRRSFRSPAAKSKNKKKNGGD